MVLQLHLSLILSSILLITAAYAQESMDVSAELVVQEQVLAGALLITIALVFSLVNRMFKEMKG